MLRRASIRKLGWLVALTCALVCRSPAVDEAPQTAGPSPTNGANPLERHEAAWLWRVTLELQLEPGTGAGAHVFAQMRQFDRQRRALLLEHQRLTARLEAEVEDKAPHEESIRWLIARLMENGRERRVLKTELFQGLQPFLTLAQQARFLTASPRFLRAEASAVAAETHVR